MIIKEEGVLHYDDLKHHTVNGVSVKDILAETTRKASENVKLQGDDRFARVGRRVIHNHYRICFLS